MCSLIKGVMAFMAWTMSPPRWMLAVRYCAQSDELRNTRSSLCPLMMTTDGFQTLVFSVRKEHRARHSICTTPCMLCAGASACVWERQAYAPRGGGTAAVAESACGSPSRCIRILRCMASGSCAQTAGGRRRRGPRAQVEAVEALALLLRRRRRCLGGRRRGDGQPEEVDGARWLRHGREHRRRIGRRLEQAGHRGRRRRRGRRVERARYLGLWL